MSEMITMAPPWQGVTREAVLSAVAAGSRPSIASELAASAPTGWTELMQQCWDQEPQNRPDFDAIHNDLKQIESGIGRRPLCQIDSQGADGEGLSHKPKAWFRSRPTPETNTRDYQTEMITHAGNNKLVTELQSVHEPNRHKQKDIRRITII